MQKNWVVWQEGLQSRSQTGVPGIRDEHAAPALPGHPGAPGASRCLFNRQLMSEKLMYNEYFLLNSYFPQLYPDNNVNPDQPVVNDTILKKHAHC